MMYARGLGSEVDYAAAQHWYLKAAEQGRGEGPNSGSGVLHANGFGVEGRSAGRRRAGTKKSRGQRAFRTPRRRSA